MTISRRRFCEGLVAGAGFLASKPAGAARPAGMQPQASGPHLGNLYPFVQQQADRSRFELSFLQSKFTSLQRWKPTARAKVFELLCYSPPPVAPNAQLVRQVDRGDYVEEYLTFQTTPDLRVTASVLVPATVRKPAPAILVLHSHDGIYLWGREKVVENEQEHPYLTAFKQQRYAGKSIAAELAREGYVVMAIDMFYWGERRMVLDDDPIAYRERPVTMLASEVESFNQRASQQESLLARSLFTAGITWPGVVMWDDIRCLDYLSARPDVDPKRLGCVGLSVGGYRSFLLAALDERIKAAVDVGWMTSFAAQIRRHILNTVGFSFHINGLYRYMDLPDLAALIAPRAVLVINGSRDALFAPDGTKAAFDKIARCYAKASVPDRQRCRLYDAPHEFNADMQAEAWEWLRRFV